MPLVHLLDHLHFLLALNVQILALEVLILVRLENIDAQAQDDLKAYVWQIFEFDDVMADIFTSVLDANEVEDPSADGREIPLNEDIEEIKDPNRQAVDKQSQPQISVLVVMVHHAQDQEHDEQEHIYHRWARD